MLMAAYCRNSMEFRNCCYLVSFLYIFTTTTATNTSLMPVECQMHYIESSISAAINEYAKMGTPVKIFRVKGKESSLLPDVMFPCFGTSVILYNKSSEL